MSMKPCYRCFSLACTMVLAVLFATGCGEDIPPGNTQPEQVLTIKTDLARVETIRQPVFYEAVATIAPETGATVSAQVMGQVETVRFEEGRHVKKGELLLTITSKRISAGLDEAKAGLQAARQGRLAAESALKAAEAAADFAEATYRRYKALLKTESVSRQEFDQVEASWKQASASLEQSRSMKQAAEQRVSQAEAGLAAAQSAFNDTRIRSPYDAVVSTKLVEPGDLAVPGTPLFRLEKIGAFEARLILPESHISSIVIGENVSVRIESLKGEPVIGKIKSIDPAADPASRSFQVKVALPDTPGLRSGVFARVKVPIGEAGMILIPRTAIIRHGQLQGAFIADEKQIVHFRLIRTGRVYGDRVEVLSGLKGGETYVVSPDHRIKAGVKVTA